VNHSKWSIEIGTGISNGTRPYTDEYYTSFNNKLFNGFILNCYSVGARYNFSEIVGLKMDIAFDRFINSEETKSKPFEVAQYRASIQSVFNLNSLIKPIHDVSRFNLLFRAGIHLAIMKPIAADYNKKVSNGDHYGGIVFGITPTVRILKKTTIFLDISSFNNYGQNLTWNGKHSKASDNSEGHMYSGTIGLSFALDKNTKKTKSL
jgi:OOP family OmpA-OmpF porin